MHDEAAQARAQAIKTFAGLLRELRAGCGNPSFREMSGRSRAISHTTLHEAAQGNRLPSWETTVEFVKACGADPADYRDRWERAAQAVRSANGLNRTVPVVSGRAAANAADPGGADGGDAGDGRGPTLGPTLGPAPSRADGGPDAAPIPALAGRPGRRRAPVVVATVGGVIVLAVVLVVILAVHSVGGKPKRSSSSAALSPADCPVHGTNPPVAPPAHYGDASAFLGDITLPDCSHVRRQKTVTKIWRLQNIGKVPWRGYSLHRMDPAQRRDQCQTISDVPIPDTPVGGTVDIRVEVTTPPKPTFCLVRFKMLDANGVVAFPGRRPVNFQIIVD